MREPRSAQFIVRCTRTHKSKISRAVTRLALAGLIEGVPNHDDRRETPLRMTNKGKASTRSSRRSCSTMSSGFSPASARRSCEDWSLGLDRLERALGLVQDPEECP